MASVTNTAPTRFSAIDWIALAIFLAPVIIAAGATL